MSQHMISENNAIAVTGVGEVEEDEFLLTLLNEQVFYIIIIWSFIIFPMYIDIILFYYVYRIVTGNVNVIEYME